MSLTVGPVGREEYLEFIAKRPVSYLQCPSWVQVKDDWQGEHLGWRTRDGALVGVAIVLFRRLPRTSRFLAFLPEGPGVDWSAHPVADVLDPLLTHVRRRGALGLRLGPDLVLNRWRAATLKAAVGAGRRLADVPADETDPAAERLVTELTRRGGQRTPEDDGLYSSTRQSVRVELARRTPEDLLAGMNQQWRRGIRKAEKAGVVVQTGGAADLPDFYRVYEETARRDGFHPQTFAHFERMWAALDEEEPERIRLYLARHEGDVLAAMLVVCVGAVAGYAFGGSADRKREVYASNAAHWRILRDLLHEGADTYDMRGIGDSLDPDDPRFGLIRFKLGTGGDAVRLVGDWDFPLRPVLYRAALATLRRLFGARRSLARG
jgi:lipid II:glycine glycyltransferase (peptidoglycan interpeptide bridge formation enzyme)